MKQIYIVRHCSAEGQQKDSPLTKKGMEQAKRLSDFLSNVGVTFDRIICSPYLRATDSIKPFSEKENLKIHIENRLKERVLSEKPIDNWMEFLEQSFNDYHFRLHGGESAHDAIQRSNTVLESIYANDDVKNVIVVSHGNLIALLLSQFDDSFGFDKWKKLHNPDVFKLHYDNNKVQSITCVW